MLALIVLVLMIIIPLTDIRNNIEPEKKINAPKNGVKLISTQYKKK